MPTTATTKPSTIAPAIKVADEVWLATLMLHQRHPECLDFSIEEIMEFAATAKELRIMGPLRPGFYVHVVQHCVANRPPNPGRYRMLLETSPGRRRSVSVLAMLIIRNEKEERFRLSPKTCPKTGLKELSRGIAIGAQKRQSERSKTIP